MNRVRGLIVAALLAVVAVPAVAQDMEAAVQAEFIERFTRFIEWPAGSSVADTSVPFVIGVLGDSPLSNALNQLSTRARIKGKAIQVRPLPDLGGVGDCQIVFISSSRQDQLQALNDRVKGRPILTVADSPGLAQKGVMINFTREGDFIRFEINTAATKSAKLKLAPELLALGQVVR